MKRHLNNTLSLHISKNILYGGSCVICGGIPYLSLLYPEASDTRATFLKHLILCPHLREKKGKSNLLNRLSALNH